MGDDPRFSDDPQRLASGYRSALFVDFDNVYSGLFQRDRIAAKAFASNPERWVPQLSDQGKTDGVTRRFLVRHCYLNPSVYSEHRPAFTRAGFRIVDCPSLTQQGKSSADIHMVLDAVDALAANTRYDEFFIIADDADYTPLVQRLRAADRRVTIVTAGHTASAYRAVADAVVSGDEFVRLLTPGAPNETERAPSVNKARYAAEYEPGQIVMGTVSRIKTYGAFVRLEGGIHGLVHISELAPHFVKSPRQVVAIDDEVRVKIIDIDVDRRQIALSLKQAKEEGDRTSAEADPSPYEVGAEFDKQGSSGHPEGLNPQKTRQRALGLIGAHDANASHPEAPLPSDVAIALRKRRTES